MDDIDFTLLRLLQADGKASLASLGEEVGLSAPSVMKRVRKLEQGGVIRGYRADLDGRELGLDVTAFIGISLNYPKNVGAFAELVRGLDGVQECHHVTGKWSLLLKVKAANTVGLEELISTLRAPGLVERTETLVVLSTQKEATAVPLPIHASDVDAHAGLRLLPNSP